MSELTGPVEVVGTGLLGTSVGLALPSGRGRGAAQRRQPRARADRVRPRRGPAAPAEDRPQLVVVAVPPDHLGEVIAAALAASDAVVTDVGSVKSAPLAAVLGRPGADRYVGGHPMAGSEQSGPLAATATLFDGRPWAVTPHPGARLGAVELVEELVELCGATKVWLTPDEHDRAVARTSHVPHLLATLVAARLAERPGEPPRALRPGRPRRHPGGRGGPGALQPDRGRERRRGRRRCWPRSATSSTT